MKTQYYCQKCGTYVTRFTTPVFQESDLVFCFHCEKKEIEQTRTDSLNEFKKRFK